MSAAQVPNQVPRPLTEAEITSIVDRLPNPPGVGRRNVLLARRQHETRLRRYLRTIKLVPAGFETLTQAIVDLYYRSLIEPGTPVGVQAGTSLTAHLTQMTMLAVHKAGAVDEQSSLFDHVRSYLNGTQTDRQPSMRLLLRIPGPAGMSRWTFPEHPDLHGVLHTGTEDQVQQLRRQLEQTTVADLVGSSSLLNQDEAASLRPVLELHALLRPQRFGNLANYPLSVALRLDLNLYRMYTHRITMAMIATAIEGSQWGGASTTQVNPISCIWPDSFSGRMYLVINQTVELGMGTEDRVLAAQLFLRTILTAEFPNWIVAGLKGIISIGSTEVRVLSVVDSVVPAPDESTDLVISDRRSRIDGPSVADVCRLLEQGSLTILDLIPPTSRSLPPEPARIRVAGRWTLAQLQEQLNPLPDSRFLTLQTNGTNFSGILWREDVDLTRSYPMHSHRVVEHLGIDAARMYLTEEFTRTLTSVGSYINPAHVMLVFDMLTNLGVIDSMSASGVNRRAVGPLTASTMAAAMASLSNSAAFGESDPAESISAKMSLGQLSKFIGTGITEVVIDPSRQPDPEPAGGQLIPFVDLRQDLDDDDASIPETVAPVAPVAPRVAPIDARAQVIPEDRLPRRPLPSFRYQATVEALSRMGQLKIQLKA